MAYLDAQLSRVAIIGGGWAGLAAAVELCAAGADVTVFEAARQLGGRARSVDCDGRRLDNGQHILIGAYRETLRLMRLVGADPERLLKRIPLQLDFPRADFRLRVPRLPHFPHSFNVALGLLLASACPLHEKLAVARFMRFMQAVGFQLADDCTVAELLVRHRQGRQLRRFLWEPLCLAALNTAPERASAQVFANVLRDSLGGRTGATDLLLPAADLGNVFPLAAARFVEANGGKIRLSTRVDAVSRPSPPALMILGESYDQVIVAVAPQHAAKLLSGHLETSAPANLIADYAFEPIATLYAAYPPDVRLPLPMLGLDGGRSASIGQWVFDRGSLGDAAGLLSFVLSGHGAWEALDNEALLAALHDELEATLKRKLPAPGWNCTLRERRATYACVPKLTRPPAQTPLAGLWLAGDYVCPDYPATLEAAIRSGMTAARGIMESR